jgi:hypothetical protein
MDDTKLEQLIKDGWEYLDRYGDCKIYGKDSERLLYDPKRDVIHIRYTLDGGHTKLDFGLNWD